MDKYSPADAKFTTIADFQSDGTGDQINFRFGSFVKSETFQRITFTPEFPHDGEIAVLVTSFWSGQNAEVGHVETLQEVNRFFFVIGSENTARNYFVNWMAMQIKP
jgi:hypothetical protein